MLARIPRMIRSRRETNGVLAFAGVMKKWGTSIEAPLARVQPDSPMAMMVMVVAVMVVTMPMVGAWEEMPRAPI